MNAIERMSVRIDWFALAAKFFIGLLAICLTTLGSVLAASASSAIVTEAGPVKGVQMFGVHAYLGNPLRDAAGGST